MPSFLITYSPLLLVALTSVLGIAAIVSILRRATRQQEDLDLHLQDRLLFDHLSSVLEDRPAKSKSQARPALKPVAPSRRVEPVSAPTDKPTLPLLQLDHVSARRPLKLALEKI